MHNPKVEYRANPQARHSTFVILLMPSAIPIDHAKDRDQALRLVLYYSGHLPWRVFRALDDPDWIG